MTRWRSMLGLALVLGVAASGTVSAEAKTKPKDLVTISLTAVVELVDDPSGLACSGVAAGDTITATYTYDPLTPDADGTPNTGAYVSDAPPSGFRVDLGDAFVETDTTLFVFQVLLIDNQTFGFDNYQVTSNGALKPTACGLSSGLILFQLDDPTHTALTSVALPTTPPNLADFAGNRLEVFGQTSDLDRSFYIRAHVTSLYPCPCHLGVAGVCEEAEEVLNATESSLLPPSRHPAW